MYLINTDLTVNWVFASQADVITRTDLDIQITDPDGNVTYTDSAIAAEDFLAPTVSSDGYAAYTFTADVLGLWSIVLTNGTGVANTVYKETKIYVDKNDILTKKFIDGSLL